MAFLDNKSPPSVESQRFKRDELRVEEILTPSKPSIDAAKSVRFSNIIEEMDLNRPSPIILPPTGEDLLGSETFLFDAFGEAAKKANQQLEQETLIEADTTARVEVRPLEYMVTYPPWHNFRHCKSSTELLAMQMEVMNSISIPSLKRYPSLKEKLRYVPFSHDLAKVVLEETFQGSDEAWNNFVTPTEAEDIVDSSNLTWKPPGLRILKFDEDKDEDDDEIGTATFSKSLPIDLAFLVKKRKLDLQQSGCGGSREGTDINLEVIYDGADSQFRKRLRQSTPKPSNFITSVQEAQPSELEPSSGLLGGRFLAENMLANFMEIRGAKKRKVVDTASFPIEPGKDQSCISKPAAPLLAADVRNPIRSSPLAKQHQLPAPAILSRRSESVMASSTLFKHRALIKHLETHLPNLTLVERDFAAHNTITWMPGSVTRSPITSALDSEADLIISSSTGVVITTLQKIKQKPLPGTKAKSEARARLEKVSLRYEKLVVLVTEGRNEESTDGLDERDCLALSEFIGFTAGLVATTIVQFVGGGEETLAKWLADTIFRHKIDAHTELLAEETHWELFLRRAGMNAFAAQDIIGRLKAPEAVDAMSSSKAGQFGLTAFVEMGKEMRIKRFGGICGRGVIERVSAIVDARWS